MRFRGGNLVLFSCAALAGFLAATPALAAVKRQGTWPEKDTLVSLDVTRVPREEAIRKLADAAGWSVVVHAPQADPVDVHVKEQPASKVLDLLLLDADYVATRDGTLVSIRRDAPPSPVADGPKKGDHDDDDDEDQRRGHGPIPPVPPVPPDAPDAPEPPSRPASRADHGRDREVMGESLKIAKNEVVDDVSVMGGSLDVYGTVTGDIDVAGGTVRIHPGGHVHGDVSAMGGDIRVDDGGRIDGELAVVGGIIRRGDKAIIGGAVHGAARSDKGGSATRDPAAAATTPGPVSDERVRAAARDTAGKVGGAFARMALLFVLGTVLLALVPERMDALKAELVARPMRSFAMGVLGALGAAAAFLVLCVTVIGVPVALLGALALFLAVLASTCAVLETIGRALTGHKTQNPYVHLATGCALFLAVSAIPVVGPIAVSVVVLLALGIVVSTRAAGFVQRQTGGP